MVSSPLVIIPAYNEARFVGETVRRVLAAGNYPVLVIDDGSADETREVALAAVPLSLPILSISDTDPPCKPDTNMRSITITRSWCSWTPTVSMTPSGSEI